jgi:hypothetical protein
VRLDARIEKEYIEQRLSDIQKKNHTTEKLATPVHINGIEFDGSQDITIAATGSGTIGGFPVNITQANDNDVLVFNASIGAWVDVNKQEIVDGGNF